MGKQSLPKQLGDEETFTPKNKRSSMLNDKRCKRNKRMSRKVLNQRKWGSKNGCRPRAVQCPTGLVLRKREGKSKLKRIHAKVEGRKDIAQDVVITDRWFRLRQDAPWRSLFTRDRLLAAWNSDDSDDEGTWKNSRHHEPFFRHSWEPSGYVRPSYRRNRRETRVDMDEVLECGLTRRQVQELQTRDITPDDFQLLLELDEKVAKKTLDEERLDAIAKRATFGESDEAAECGVCLGDLEVDDAIVRLPCNHVFHDECITKWLTEFNTTCPFKCNLEVIAEDQDGEEQAKEEQPEEGEQPEEEEQQAEGEQVRSEPGLEHDDSAAVMEENRSSESSIPSTPFVGTNEVHDYLTERPSNGGQNGVIQPALSSITMDDASGVKADEDMLLWEPALDEHCWEHNDSPERSDYEASSTPAEHVPARIKCWTLEALAGGRILFGIR